MCATLAGCILYINFGLLYQTQPGSANGTPPPVPTLSASVPSVAPAHGETDEAAVSPADAALEDEPEMVRQPLSPLERGGYTFWSTDYHIAPIADVADLFSSLCSNEKLCMKVRRSALPMRKLPQAAADAGPNRRAGS